jgi:ribosome-binding protein aMBF1 (putative translation factor)
MIRTEREYQEAQRKLEEDRDFALKQRAALEDLGLPSEHVQLAMQPLLSFQAQLEEEVAWYERVKRRDFEPLSRLTELGRLLIAMRIASGMSQRDLAMELGVDESQISRDERNEYYNITVERAQAIVDVLSRRLQMHVVTRVEEGIDERELVSI